MSDEQVKSESFFEKFGLSVQSNPVEIGKTYPIYGMITAIELEEPTQLTVIINNHIRATLNIRDENHLNLVRERAMEPGIFVATFIEELVVTENNPISHLASVKTIVFGKKRTYDA